MGKMSSMSDLRIAAMEHPSAARTLGLSSVGIEATEEASRSHLSDEVSIGGMWQKIPRSTSEPRTHISKKVLHSRELNCIVVVSLASHSSSQSWAKEDPERGKTLGLSPKGA